MIDPGNTGPLNLQTATGSDTGGYRRAASS